MTRASSVSAGSSPLPPPLPPALNRTLLRGRSTDFGSAHCGARGEIPTLARLARERARAQAYRAKGIKELYSHQAASAGLVHGAKNGIQYRQVVAESLPGCGRRHDYNVKKSR